MKQAAFFSNNVKDIERVYGLGRRDLLAEKYDLYPEVIMDENIDRHIGKLKNLEYIFSTWGMITPKDRHFDAMPRLKAVLYAASSVKYFAEPFLKRGIQVVSAASANAEFVADFAASQIQLAAKGYFHNFRSSSYLCKNTRSERQCPGIFEINVGLLGAGFVGRQVVERLSKLPCIYLQVYDPYLTEKDAAAMGVKKVSLEQLFRDCDVVSNHVPDTLETRGMMKYEHFASMKTNAVFVNTGRGASVEEDGMIRALKERSDLVALLDVTWPEPPEKGSELYILPNVFYTSHIAGARGNEVCHMADMCIKEAEMIEKGLTPPHGVSLERLKTMA